MPEVTIMDVDTPELKDQPNVFECCQNPSNLYLAEVQGMLKRFKCRTCERRHTVLVVEKGNLGVFGSRM